MGASWEEASRDASAAAYAMVNAADAFWDATRGALRAGRTALRAAWAFYTATRRAKEAFHG